MSKGIVDSAAFALPWAAGEEMARYKGYDYTQTVLIPVSFEHQLLPGTLEFAIQALVERHIDTASFGGRYKNDETGNVSNLLGGERAAMMGREGRSRRWQRQRYGVHTVRVKQW